MKITKTKNPSKKVEEATGFLGGLNTFQDETTIKDSELTEAKNIILNVTGVEPRDGTVNFGSSSGTKVLGSFPFYKSNGTSQLLRYSKGANNKLQKYVGGVPTDIGSNTYDASAKMNFIQADDDVYTFNGVDPLTSYDGSSITTYTQITFPTSVTVTPQGTTGSTSYSYRISAINAVGQTIATTSAGTTTGNATLNATNFNRVTWVASAGATGYRVYGRFATGLTETLMTTVYTTTYDDKGTDTPSLSVLPPTTNDTGGIIGSMAEFAIGRIFVAGIKDEPSRISFSGTGEDIGNFSSSTSGGLNVYKNDGAVITAIKPFQGGVIIWKSNAIYKLSFQSDNSLQLEEIVRGFGSASYRGVVQVENDIIFPCQKDGRLAFYSLGNQENYIATVLRTNELSIKVAEKLKDINLSGLENATSTYFNNLYMCSVPKSGSSVNNRTWVLDTRFGAWVYHEGLDINNYVEYNDGTDTKLYYGDDSSGYLVEMFTDDKNDNGNAIEVEFSTKSFNQGKFYKRKKYYRPTFQFKDVSTTGELNGYIYIDGVEIGSTFSITQVTTGRGGIGVYIPGFTGFGDTPGVISGASGSNDIPIELYEILRGRSIKYVFTSSSANTTYKLLSIAHIYEILGTRIPSTFRAYPN